MLLGMKHRCTLQKLRDALVDALQDESHDGVVGGIFYPRRVER